MKWIQYALDNPVNIGTEQQPQWVENLLRKSLPDCEENEAIARQEAYNGVYTVTEDDITEDIQPSQEARITELEEALALLLSGVTE